MITINEIETDQHIIISEDRIKELVIEIYSMIIDRSDLTKDKYNQLITEINEIVQVYEIIANSEGLLAEIFNLRQMLNLYASDKGL